MSTQTFVDYRCLLPRAGLLFSHFVDSSLDGSCSGIQNEDRTTTEEFNLGSIQVTEKQKTMVSAPSDVAFQRL